MSSRIGKGARLIAALVLCAGIAYVALRSGGLMSREPRGPRHDQSVVIRHPDSQPAVVTPASNAAHHGLQNIAPLATVAASSFERSAETAAGVADGLVDQSEWIAGERAGAWIELSWDRPVTVMEVTLFDLADPEDNVLGGLLTFDDGSVVTVPALPPDGSPWSVTFPPKTVRSVVFRIVRAQGLKTGLAEIMIFGTLK